MYESPVNLVVQNIESQIVQESEQTIINVIRKCGVTVDKDELIKAMSYDRNQYTKGYKDGVNNTIDKLRAEIEQTVSRYSISQERGGMGQVEWSDSLIKESEILNILDKYKMEGEIK